MTLLAATLVNCIQHGTKIACSPGGGFFAVCIFFVCVLCVLMGFAIAGAVK